MADSVSVENEGSKSLKEQYCLEYHCMIDLRQTKITNIVQRIAKTGPKSYRVGRPTKWSDDPAKVTGNRLIDQLLWRPLR